MKNSRGISVLALVITVVVIVIITSITVYTGVNTISDARQKDASDKLKVICNEIRKNDNLLNSGDGSFMFTEANLEQLGLEDYYDEEYPIQFEKETKVVDASSKNVTYRLKMYKGDDTTTAYAEEYFVTAETLEKSTYTASFNELKGVNRPILYENMYAIKSGDNITLVDDVYEDEWYDYLSVAPSFAKMQYGSGENDNGIFVWIPRYAYSIQTYYNGANNPERAYGEVPNSAIKIVFLKETTNYMANDELMPNGYMVHPAFSNDNGEFAGIWVALNASSGTATLASAISKTNSMQINSGKENTHLMTNTEFGAALYLMHALNSYDQINFSKREFVAATIKGASTSLKNSKYCDFYELDSDSTTGLKEKLGDAMIETNWGRTSGSAYMTSEKPCLVRAIDTDDSYFDFIATAESTKKYYYRAVIVN